MSGEKTPLKDCPYHTTKKGIVNITKFLGRLASRIENNPKKELLKLLLVDIANLQKFEGIAKKYDIPSAINTKELLENLAHDEGLPAWLREAGAIMAWLNTGRCPGRGYAAGGLDHREVLDEDISHQQVFDAVVDHLRYGLSSNTMTNQAITLFPRHVKILNPVMLTFAGYENGLGQKSNAELTRKCEQLGRKAMGEKGNFDILPLVIEINGELQYFEYPPDLQKTIPIASDKYPSLKELGLQRSQMPSQCVKLHLGPENFTAVINGPRTVAEIIEMNLLNIERFDWRNQLSEVFGINKDSHPQTWEMEIKTKLVEAIFHSYKIAGAKALIGDRAIDGSVEGFHKLLDKSGLGGKIDEDIIYAGGAMIDFHSNKSYKNKEILAEIYQNPKPKGAYFSF